TPVRVSSLEQEEEALNVATRRGYGDGRRDAHVEEQIRFLGSAAGAPGVSTPDAAEIHDGLLAAMACLLLPSFNPLQDGRHEFDHAADGIHFFAAFAEGGVHINSGTRDAHPHGAEMFEYDTHVGGLAENTHVGQHAMIDEIVRAVSVTAVFFAFEFTPLRFFDFAGDGGDDDVAFQAHTGALERFHGVGVTDQRTLHVVDAEAVDKTVFDDSVRFVAEAGEKFFAASIGGIHVAVEHQVLAAARAFPTADHIGARLFDFLPG